MNKEERKARRLEFRVKSLVEQRIAWIQLGTAYPEVANDAAGEINRIDRRIKKIGGEVPSETWLLDAKGLPEVKEGQWPPGGYQGTTMIRAVGERRLYPRMMLTSSGHSYDVYLQSYHLHRTQYLIDEQMPDDDGYRGSIVRINDLHPAQRRSLYHVERRYKSRRSRKIFTDFSGV